MIRIDTAPESARRSSVEGEGNGGLQIFDKVNRYKIITNRMATPERRL
jgi:hypothetical protein